MTPLLQDYLQALCTNGTHMREVTHDCSFSSL